MKRFSIAAFVVVATLVFAPARAQQAAHPGANPSGQGSMQSCMGATDQANTMADLAATDARLQSLVEQMNGAQGDAKVAAMQNLLAELVQNEVAMHQRLAMMHDHMMAHGPTK